MIIRTFCLKVQLRAGRPPHIIGQAGYRDGVTLRTLLRKRLGKGLRGLRD